MYTCFGSSTIAKQKNQGLTNRGTDGVTDRRTDALSYTVEAHDYKVRGKGASRMECSRLCLDLYIKRQSGKGVFLLTAQCPRGENGFLNVLMIWGGKKIYAN